MGDLSKLAIIVLNHDRQYSGNDEEGTVITILEKNMHFGHLKILSKSRSFTKYKGKYGAKVYPPWSMWIEGFDDNISNVVLFSLSRDAEKLVYGKIYLARFMEAAILTIENEAQTACSPSAYNNSKTWMSVSESNASQNAYEIWRSRSWLEYRIFPPKNQSLIFNLYAHIKIRYELELNMYTYNYLFQ